MAQRTSPAHPTRTRAARTRADAHDDILHTASTAAILQHILLACIAPTTPRVALPTRLPHCASYAYSVLAFNELPPVPPVPYRLPPRLYRILLCCPVLCRARLPRRTLPRYRVTRCRAAMNADARVAARRCHTRGHSAHAPRVYTHLLYRRCSPTPRCLPAAHARFFCHFSHSFVWCSLVLFPHLFFLMTNFYYSY